MRLSISHTRRAFLLRVRIRRGFHRFCGGSVAQATRLDRVHVIVVRHHQRVDVVASTITAIQAKVVLEVVESRVELRDLLVHSFHQVVAVPLNLEPDNAFYLAQELGVVPERYR
jgi:hypothetical protein